ncbi:hypothetical protein ACPV4Z_12870 [Vibrio aestuarianus]|uniref:hypothetical protein n=1 Tax=Vibrio aestuarianus TaxID=28171 RepID=UPI0040677336
MTCNSSSLVPKMIGHAQKNFGVARFNENVFEFDLCLWTLLKSLSSLYPEEVSEQFSLPLGTVTALASASESQLKLLSSGAIISFKLSGCEKDYIEYLEGHYDHVSLINNQDTGLSSAYWLLMGRIAHDNTDIAAQIFDVTTSLTKSVAEATDNQLRSLACDKDMPFAIRFSPKLVKEILESDECHVTHLILKKHQQSLSNGGRYEL